jgi:4-amino-4-deoxy-L-arabinose transferase-like glycosyltransferase
MKLSFNRAFDQWWPKKQPPALAGMSILWLLLIGWLAFFWNLGSTGLIDETEPLFAEAARQMTLTGDWITPFFDGQTRFDKPPLIYWLMAIAYLTLGVNEWAVRLPSAIAAMGLVSLGFYTLCRFGAPSTSGVQLQRSSKFKHPYWFAAALGSAVMALNLETIVWARSGVSDMLLSGCMGSALLSFFIGYAQPSKPAVQARWYLAFYVLIAAAILTKGPVGIVLPGLIIASFLLYVGNALEVLREMRVFLGSLLIVAIALPWYVLVIWRNGRAYIDAFFGYHNLERFTGVVNGHAAPWYFYFLVVLIGFAPWSIYLPSAIARLQFWQRSHWRSAHRSTHLGLFALFWFVVVFGFFTIAVTKLPSYVLPLMPAAAILVALLFSADNSKNAAKNSLLFLLSGWLNVVLLLAVAAALFYLPDLIGSDPAIPDLHKLIQQSGLPVLGGFIWAITALVVAVLLLRRQWRWLWSINLLGFMAFLIFVLTPVYFLVDQARQQPLRELSLIAAKVEQPGEDLIMIGFPKPSVVFYSQRPVTYIKIAEDGVAHIQKWVNNPMSPDSVLVLTQPKRVKKLGLQPPQYQNLAKVGAYQLIRVFKTPE